MLRRGNVTANLSVRHDSELRLIADPAALDQVVALAMDLHKRIPGSPVPRAEALLGLPGVLRLAQADAELATDAAAAGYSGALALLVAAREAEGARLSRTVAGLLDEIAALHRQAASEAADQPAAQRARVMENLAALLREAPVAAGGTHRPGGGTAGRAFRRARRA